MLFRALGIRNGIPAELIGPGDNLVSSLQRYDLTTGAVTGLWTADAMNGGFIVRAGPAAPFTDTMDTAANILASLGGNAVSPPLLRGLSWQLIVRNTTAFAQTVALGEGIILNPGTTLGNIAIPATSWKEYLLTILAGGPPFTAQAMLTSGSNLADFVFPQGQTAFLMGPSQQAVALRPGMQTISGVAGIPANTTVVGLKQGQGGYTGFSMSVNATASSPANGQSVTFLPTIQLDVMRGGSL